MSFKTGDTIRYKNNTGTCIESYVGKTAVVVDVTNYGDVKADFGKGGARDIRYVSEKNCELLVGEGSGGGYEWNLPTGTIIKHRDTGYRYMVMGMNVVNVNSGSTYKDWLCDFADYAELYDVDNNAVGAYIRKATPVHADGTIARATGHKGAVRIKVAGDWYVLTDYESTLRRAEQHPENPSSWYDWEIIHTKESK